MYQAEFSKYTSHLAPTLPCEGGVFMNLFDYVIICFSDEDFSVSILTINPAYFGRKKWPMFIVIFLKSCL